MRVKLLLMTEFVVIYSYLRPTVDTVDPAGVTLVYWDRDQLRYIYFFMTKGNYTEAAKYDDLKSFSRELRAHASLESVSFLAMPRIGVVDDRLGWPNFDNCLELIFQDVYCTVTVCAPETEHDFCLSPSHHRENVSNEPNHCAVQ